MLPSGWQKKMYMENSKRATLHDIGGGCCVFVSTRCDPVFVFTKVGVF